MLHPARQSQYESLAKRTVEALKRNNFDAVYYPTSAEACEAILGMIPKGATVGFGGSMTLEQMGLNSRIKEAPVKLINPAWIWGSTPRDELRALHRQALNADVFLTSTNAVTLDGKLVNTDGSGNRVVGMVFGPKKAIIVAGVNKITRNLDEAMDRVTYVASPANAIRLNRNTPCATTGECADCRSEDRICNATVILRKKPSAIDVTVVLVGEELGL